MPSRVGGGGGVRRRTTRTSLQFIGAAALHSGFWLLQSMSQIPNSAQKLALNGSAVLLQGSMMVLLAMSNVGGQGGWVPIGRPRSSRSPRAAPSSWRSGSSAATRIAPASS